MTDWTAPHDEYALYVTSIPSLPAITWHERAVIVPDSCVQLAQLVILIRHEHGRAHFGPTSECGEPTTADILRGNLLLHLLEHEVDAAMESKVIRAVPMSTLN